MGTSKNSSGYLYLLNTVLLFSTYEVVSKTLIGKINPFQINFLRFFAGGLILFVFIAAKRDLSITKKQLLSCTAVGIINVFLSMNLLQLSLFSPNAKASVTAVIFSSNPIFVFIFAALIDKEKIKLYKIAGLVIGLFGIFVIFFERLSINIADFKSPLLAFLSALLYGLYTVLGRKVSVEMGSLKMNSYSFIIGSAVLLPFLKAFHVPIIKFDYSGIWQVAYLSVMVTGLAYLTYFKGLSYIGASKGSLVFFLKPALASIIAIVFLHEKASISMLIGTLLIISGILTVIYWPVFKEKISKKFEGIYQ